MDTRLSFPSFSQKKGRDRAGYDSYDPDLLDVSEEEDVDRLHAEIERLHARVIELEERISTQVPRSGAVLGERIALVLQSAEEAAADTVTRAEAAAAHLEDKARQTLVEAEEQARLTVSRAEEQARRLEAAARAEATEIQTGAEARAAERTRDIERWAQEVVSHTRAQEARMLKEQQDKRTALEAEMEALGAERDAAADNLVALRQALGEALDLIGGSRVRVVGLTGGDPDLSEATPAAGTEPAPGWPAGPSAPNSPLVPTTIAAPTATAAASASAAPAPFDAWAPTAEADDEMPWPSASTPSPAAVVHSAPDVVPVREPAAGEEVSAADEPTGPIPVLDLTGTGEAIPVAAVEAAAADRPEGSGGHGEGAGADEEMDARIDAFLSEGQGTARHFRR